MSRRTLRILGIRGIPASHGGFETFAEYLALYLVERGWRVIVYCQEEGDERPYTGAWKGVERVHIPVLGSGARSTVVFDWLSTRHAMRTRELCLTLGYNTAVFCSLLRWRRVPNLINMDGIEWARAKWGRVAKAWFWLNERAGCWLGNHLVADHPEIKRHLAERATESKITMIPYGGDALAEVSSEPVRDLGLVPGRYLTVIARPEPENSLLEIVSGFSAERRDATLVVLGKYDKDNAYHRAVLAAAGPEVRFVGAIYDKRVVQALRFHSFAYVHGHQVGGTNPSLVEALGAGNAVLAHDNRFNRWVAGEAAKYFQDASSFSSVVRTMLKSTESSAEMKAFAARRFNELFTWENVLSQYETLLTAYLPRAELDHS